MDPDFYHGHGDHPCENVPRHVHDERENRESFIFTIIPSLSSHYFHIPIFSHKVCRQRYHYMPPILSIIRLPKDEGMTREPAHAEKKLRVDSDLAFRSVSLSFILNPFIPILICLDRGRERPFVNNQNIARTTPHLLTPWSSPRSNLWWNIGG